jgi:pimeloyl-ACP methyl ester carboxylesterase
MESGARFLLRLARIAPEAILGPLALLRGGVALDPSLLMSLLYAEAPSPDHAILSQAEVRQMFVAAFREAVRGGARAMAHEVSLLPRPWGFELEDVRPPVALYHGDTDTLAPLEMGRYVADHLPHATLRVFPGEAHQLIWPRWEQILGQLGSKTREWTQSSGATEVGRVYTSVAATQPAATVVVEQ